METSSELIDDNHKLQAGLQRFSRRGLVAVQSGQGADRKTGWLHGGHYPLGAKNCEMLVQCTSPCCAGRPLALQPAGCLFTGSEFERHAGCERHKRWSESIRVLGPEGWDAQAPAGTDADAKPEQAAAAMQAAPACAAGVGAGPGSGAGGGGDGAEGQGQGGTPDLARAAARALWPASDGRTLRVFLCNVSRLLEAQHKLVGRPIWVFWLAENRWFRGKVESFHVELASHRAGPASMNWWHTVRYDDGDVEQLHLALELFSLQRPPGWRPDPLSPLGEQEQEQEQVAAAEEETEQAEAEGDQEAEGEERAGGGEETGSAGWRGGNEGAAASAAGAPCGNKRRRRSSSVRLPTPRQAGVSAAEQQEQEQPGLQPDGRAAPCQQAGSNAQQPASSEARRHPVQQDVGREGRAERHGGHREQPRDGPQPQQQQPVAEAHAPPRGPPPAVEQPAPPQPPALAPATANLEHLTRVLLAAAQQPGAADAGLSPSLVWQFLLAWRRMAEGERQDHASMVQEAARHGSPEALAELLRVGLAAA